MQHEASVAIYWDFENIHASVMSFTHGNDWFQRMKDKRMRMEDTKVLDVSAVMQYASTLGEVVINKAYANWTNFWPYTDPLNEFSMDLIQLFPLGMNAKNGADIRLSLDIAEDLVLHPHIDIVVLVSGDSDFISIAQRVRRKHKRIIGLGVKEASNRYWQLACNEFKLYRTIKEQFSADADDDDDDVAYELAEPTPAPKSRAKGTRASASAKAVAKASSKKDADAPDGDQGDGTGAEADDKSGRRKLTTEKRLLRQALQALESREGSPWIRRAKIKRMMLRLDSAFDEANYGYSNFTAFLEGNEDVVELKESDDDLMAKVKRGRRRGGRRR